MLMKGITLGQVPQVIMIVIIIGIFIGAGYMALESFQNTGYASTTVTNETINFAVNNTFYSPANPFLTGTGAVTTFTNNTYTVPSTQFQVANTAYHAYQVKLFTNATIAVGNYNVTYTYNANTKTSTGIGFVLSMLDNITSNLPTVGIMIFVGILITVVFWMVHSGKIGKGKDGGA